MTYNLADIIKYNLEKGLIFHKESIAYEYITKYRKLNTINSRLGIPPVDYALLRKIVLKKSKRLKLLPKNFLAIHMNLGDVFEKAPNQEDILKIIIQKKLNLKCDSCAIFYGFHNDIKVNESLKYIDELCAKLKLLNFKVFKYSGKVDEDFILLSTSHHYIAGYRGFGWLTASINSGKVYWDLNDPPFFPWISDILNLPECLKGYYFQKVISGEGENIGISSKRNYKYLTRKKENSILRLIKKIIYKIKNIFSIIKI